MFKNKLAFAAGILISFTSIAQENNDHHLTKPLQWRSIGPANQGGRIVDIEALESDPRKVWLATGSGGVWYSDNAGTTWTPVFDHYETASIGDIAVFQTNPNIIWVGTGEANNRNSTSWGNGIYKSTDGGKSFQHLGLSNTHHIARVILHPTDPNTAYVAATGHLWGHNEERGLYKTIDGGKSWALLKNGLPVNDKEGCTDLVMHPNNPDILFAAYYYRLRTPYHFHSGSERGGIFKSMDGGKSWKKLINGLPADSTGRIGLAISRSQPDILMAIIEAKRTDTLAIPGSGVYRSVDGGENWQYVNTYNNRPFYYSQVRIHPANPQKVYVLTTPFMVSVDGGKKFVNGSADEEIHGDFHALWHHPYDTNHYYIGADKGAAVTYDGGQKFVLFDNLPIAQYYRIGADMNMPYRIYGGMQDNGFYATESFARDARGILNDVNWKVHWGDGQYTAINPLNKDEVYTSSENGTIRSLNPVTHELKNISPTIFNITNAKKYLQPKSGQPFLRFNWSAPFLLSPHDHPTLYMGAQYVLKSVDKGKNWQFISPDLSSGDSTKIKTGNSGGLTPDNTGAEIHGTVHALAISPLNKQMLWAGTDDGLLHVSFNEGKNWQLVNNSWTASTKGLWIDRIISSAHQAMRAYVIVDGHRSNVFSPYIFKTEDGGKNWESIVNNLPATEVVRSFVEDAKNENLLFAGTETGVWISMNRGQSWSRFNKNMPVVSVYDLLIHPRDNDLVAATHGRSLWVMDDISYLQQLTPQVLGTGAWLFDQRPVVLWVNTSRGGQRGHFLFQGQNPPGIKNTGSKARAATEQSAFITVYSKEGGNISLVISDATKSMQKMIDTLLAAGVHRLEWNLHFDAPMFSIADINLIDSLVHTIPAVERSALTLLSRIKETKDAGRQREQVQRLLEANPGIPIPERLLPYAATAGVYQIELKAGKLVQKKSLVIKNDPLNDKKVK